MTLNQSERCCFHFTIFCKILSYCYHCVRVLTIAAYCVTQNICLHTYVCLRWSWGECVCVTQISYLSVQDNVSKVHLVMSCKNTAEYVPFCVPAYVYTVYHFIITFYTWQTVGKKVFKQNFKMPYQLNYVGKSDRNAVICLSCGCCKNMVKPNLQIFLWKYKRGDVENITQSETSLSLMF